MQKALDECGVKSLGCTAHKLQLAVHDGLLSQRSVSDCIANSRRLVGHFKHSQLATARLRDIQNELGLPNKIIQQDVTTRWNSTFYMMKSLLEQRRVLSVYGADHDLPLTQEISSHSASTADVIPSVVALKRLMSKTMDTDFGVRTARTHSQKLWISASLLFSLNRCTI
ncbi:hypothetical protein WMY93_030514 [Mugilogobius chulae]|uniref:Zinc finger BED domain-containing protein 4 n=1 Tax=Mugilogobius chulae TaxID=88201 RepID=A0AAW0MEU6_9GOBI